MAKYWLYAERSEAKNFLGYVAFRRVFKKMPYATSYTPPYDIKKLDLIYG